MRFGNRFNGIDAATIDPMDRYLMPCCHHFNRIDSFFKNPLFLGATSDIGFVIFIYFDGNEIEPIQR